MGLDAYHLPGVQPQTFAEQRFGDAVLRMPEATPSLVRQAAAHVTDARDQGLARMPLSRIVDAIDVAIARWQEPGYRLRSGAAHGALRVPPERRMAEEALPAITGYSRQMIAYGLPKLLEPFRREGLLALVKAELGDPKALEPSASIVLGQKPGKHDRPSGPGIRRGDRPVAPTLMAPHLTSVILAGNIPAVAVESIVHVLLVRSACLVKASSRDPLWPALFAQSLAEADAEVGAAVAVLWWKGGSAALDRAALEQADAVIAYGSEQAIASVRRQTPAGARFVDYGPRISFAAVAREALRLDECGDPSTEIRASLASRAAYDVSLFDQQGCVSPHVIYVERGGEASPLEFAQALARAMAAFEKRLPRGRISAGQASRIQQLRGAWAMRSGAPVSHTEHSWSDRGATHGPLLVRPERMAAGHGVALFESADSTAWTVAYDEEARLLAPSCLDRVVTVVPLDDLAQVVEAVRPMGRYLQTCGLEAPEPRAALLRPALAKAGVTRFCRVGEMQHPPATWPHDGKGNLTSLLT